jgi:hypothetical protein
MSKTSGRAASDALADTTNKHLEYLRGTLGAEAADKLLDALRMEQ